MVVRFQMVIETVTYLMLGEGSEGTSLGRGSLWFVVTLHVPTPHNGGVEVHELSRTQELEWPFRRVWCAAHPPIPPPPPPEPCSP